MPSLFVTYVDGGGVWSNDYKIVFPSGNYTALSLARELVNTMNFGIPCAPDAFPPHAGGLLGPKIVLDIMPEPSANPNSVAEILVARPPKKPF
jgi:hypothetical protein